jgi:hypothetical protein
VTLLNVATFPATAEERAGLEEALPGYRFVDPVDEEAFDRMVDEVRVGGYATLAELEGEDAGGAPVFAALMVQ